MQPGTPGRSGKDSIGHPPVGHDDLAVVVAGAFQFFLQHLRMPHPKDDLKSPEWRPYIFARDQWHCRICGCAADEGNERAMLHRAYFFIVSRSFIQAAIPARADFSSTPSGNPATPTPPTS
jgi:hypothetical protein